MDFFTEEGAKFLSSIAVKLNYVEKLIKQHPEVGINPYLEFFTKLNQHCKEVEIDIANIEKKIKEHRSNGGL